MNEAQAIATPVRPTPAHAAGRIARGFLEENYFYLMSAALIMTGCWKLMPDTEVKGMNIRETLKAIGVLQGYELLVIVSSILIVRHFKALNDALMLLLIELALLLDPTFFANSFATMPDAGGNFVNLVCLVLVPVKLLILQGAVRVTFSPLMLAAFDAAALIIYAGPAPLMDDRAALGLPHATYYYLLSWSPLLLAALLPAAGAMATTEAAQPDFITSAQRRRLRGFLLLAPIAIVTMHVVETAFAHDIRFYAFHLAPAFLAAGLLLVKNTPLGAGDKTKARVCLALDALALVSLVFSSRIYNAIDEIAAASSRADLQQYRSSRALNLPGFYTDGPGAVMICAAAVMGLYGYFYARLRDARALRRVAIMGFVGLAYAAFRARLAQRGWSFALDHSNLAAVAIWITLVAIAYRWRNAWTWFLAGEAGVGTIFALLPDPGVESIGFLFQSAIVVALAVDHRFSKKPSRVARYLCALILVFIGAVMFDASPSWRTGLAIPIQIIALMIAGLGLRHSGYVVIAALELMWFGWTGAMRLVDQGLTAELALGAGLALFVAGLMVTFSKGALLRWIATNPKGPSPIKSG